MYLNCENAEKQFGQTQDPISHNGDISVQFLKDAHGVSLETGAREYQREKVARLDWKQAIILTILSKSYARIPQIHIRVIPTEGGGFRFEIVDGQQRVSAPLDFIDGKFKLPTDDDAYIIDGMDCRGCDIKKIKSKKIINIGFENPDVSGEVIRTSDGGAVVVGYSTGQVSGGNEAFLVKFGPNDDYPNTILDVVIDNIVTIKESSMDKSLKIFPNPTDGILNISTENLNYSTIRIISSVGKEMNAISFQSSIKIDVSAFDPYNSLGNNKNDYERDAPKHYHQFVDACLGADKASAPFSYSARLTETILLGVIAGRFPKKTLHWDNKKARFKEEKANEFLDSPYRDF